MHVVSTGDKVILCDSRHDVQCPHSQSSSAPFPSFTSKKSLGAPVVGTTGFVVGKNVSFSGRRYAIKVYRKKTPVLIESKATITPVPVESNKLQFRALVETGRSYQKSVCQ